MALVSSLKQEVEKASKDADALNRLYNVYFSGAEENPPREERKRLEAAVASIKAQIAKANNAADRFQANTFISRYKAYTVKWDKVLRGIEAGTIPRPKKRE